MGVDVNNEWTSGFTTLAPGETLLVISDGLWAMFGGGDEALEDIIARVSQHDDLESTLNNLVADVRSNVALDDVTALAVRRELR